MTRMALALLLAAAPMAALAQETPVQTPATAPDAPAAPPAAAPATADAAADPAELAPGAEMTLGALRDRSEAEVRAKLGEPAVARREDGGAMWTYRLPACALYVYFRTAGREGLRVSGLSTGPRRRGDVAPGVDACLAAVAAT